MREGQKIFKNVQADVPAKKYRTYYAYREEGNNTFLMLHEEMSRSKAIKHFKGVAKREGCQFDETKVYAR